VTFFFLPLFTREHWATRRPPWGLGSIPGSLFLIRAVDTLGQARGALRPARVHDRRAVADGRKPAVDRPNSRRQLPWQLSLTDSSTWLPSSGYLLDILPYQLLFGLGVSIMVAPLTTALMRSVPGRQAGLASAINNAISRVGPQLAGALIFIVVTASFYATLGSLVPGLDTSSADVRANTHRSTAPLRPFRPSRLPRRARPRPCVPPRDADGFRAAGSGRAGKWVVHQQSPGACRAEWRRGRP